jgi:hypothetical protein
VTGREKSPLDHAGQLREIHVISCTSDSGKLGRRTRSQWSRVLRYALNCKSHSEPRFVKRKGGINECAFARLMGVLRGTRFKKVNLVK